VGTRVNIYVKGDKDSEVCAILFSNNSHPDVEPEALIRNIAEIALGPNDFVRKCLVFAYPSSKGNHREGQPIFTFDPYPDDHEYVLIVSGKSGTRPGMRVTKKKEFPAAAPDSAA